MVAAIKFRLFSRPHVSAIRTLAALFCLNFALIGQALADEAADLVTFLREATGITLYSIPPLAVITLGPDGTPAASERDKERFQQHEVFGKIVAKDKKTAEAIRRNLIASFTEIGEGIPSMCFEPRHGVRLEKGDKTVDLLICFECGNAELILGPAPKDRFMISVARLGRSELNRLLDERKIRRDIPK